MIWHRDRGYDRNGNLKQVRMHIQQHMGIRLAGNLGRPGMPR